MNKDQTNPHPKLTLPPALVEECLSVLVDLCAEGIFCCEVDPPIPTLWSIERKIAHVKNARITFCNDAMARMYGFAQASELLGTRLIDLLIEADPKNQKMLQDFFTQGYRLTQVESHEIDRTGHPLRLENNLVGVVEQDHLVRVWGTQRELTTDGQREEAALSREMIFQNMLHHLEQSVYMKDTDLRFVAVNRCFRETLQLPEEDILGKTVFDLYPAHFAEKFQADDLIVLTQNRRIELEEPTLIRGETRTVRVIKTPMHDSLNRVIGVLGISWDVTEQRMLESQFRHAQKLDAIGQLASGVANDFNNMLTAILGNLDLIDKSLAADHPARAYLQALEDASQRAIELIQRLTVFSRRLPLKLQPLRLDQLVRDTLDHLEDHWGPNLKVETNLNDEGCLIQGDPTQMQLVIESLLFNARDAVSGNGSITIETALVQVDSAYSAHKPHVRPGDFVCLQVSDTGCGIAEEHKARIFEPFFTTKIAPHMSLGLGLAMVYTIVERHSGWIEFQSEVDRGTTFTLYWPKYEAVAPAPEPVAPTEAISWGSATILFVEDEEILRKLGYSILSRYGYKTLLASDGYDALDLYFREKDNIDLVILDLSMPRLSGRDTYRRLRAFNPKVPVIFTSGKSDELLAQAQEDASLGCIGKPYRPQDLAQVVQEALQKIHQLKQAGGFSPPAAAPPAPPPTPGE